MNEIRFNRNYSKLHNQTMAKMIKLETHLGSLLHRDFIKYDTDGKYKIDKEQRYLCMYFVGNKGIPFTTLRKCNKTNILKYCARIGEDFKIIVEEK